MNTLLTAFVRGVAALLPLTLLSLGLVFVAGMAVVWPTPVRQAMVDRLADAMKNLGSVIAGSQDRRGAAITTGRR